MFHVMRNTTPFGTRDLVDRFMATLHTLTPRGIENSVRAPHWLEGSGDSGFDAVVPWWVDGREILLSLRVAVSPEAARWEQAPATPSRGTAVLLAPFISPSARERLDLAGWSYWDATGNTSITVRDPLLSLSREGAARNPEPQGETRPLASLKGRAASMVMVRLLTDGRAASIRNLCEQAHVGLGTASRVVSLLRDENLLEPTGGGPIVLSDRVAVARRWAEDYSFTKTFKARRYYSRLGDVGAVERIKQSGVPYAFTGLRTAASWFSAVGRVAPLPAVDAWVYTDDVAALVHEADLAPDPRRGNIWVAQSDLFLPRNEGAHTRGDEGAYTRGDENHVWPWRAVGDLLSTPGRHAAAGDALARMLASEEARWRPEAR